MATDILRKNQLVSPDIKSLYHMSNPMIWITLDNNSSGISESPMVTHTYISEIYSMLPLSPITTGVCLEPPLSGT